MRVWSRWNCPVLLAGVSVGVDTELSGGIWQSRTGTPCDGGPSLVGCHSSTIQVITKQSLTASQLQNKEMEAAGLQRDARQWGKRADHSHTQVHRNTARAVLRKKPDTCAEGLQVPRPQTRPNHAVVLRVRPAVTLRGSTDF